MKWWVSSRADPRVRPLADRHYNRQSIGSACFTPPGRCLVFRTKDNDAVWSTGWPFAQYVKHRWAGAWVNTLFRNESVHQSSLLITQAVAATLYHWKPPPLGIITFVDPKHIPATSRRGNKIYGYCYLKAGWEHVGFTEGGLWAWQLLPDKMPEPHKARGTRDDLMPMRLPSHNYGQTT